MPGFCSVITNSFHPNSSAQTPTFVGHWLPRHRQAADAVPPCISGHHETLVCFGVCTKGCTSLSLKSDSNYKCRNFYVFTFSFQVRKQHQRLISFLSPRLRKKFEPKL